MLVETKSCEFAEVILVRIFQMQLQKKIDPIVKVTAPYKSMTVRLPFLEVSPMTPNFEMISLFSTLMTLNGNWVHGKVPII